jgi:hypothetical protein
MLKQATTLSVSRAPRLALDFDPVGLLARAIRRIAAIRLGKQF